MWSYPVQSRFAWLCVMNPCDDHFLCFCELSTVRDVQEVYWAIWIWPFQLNNEISSRSLSFLNPSPPCRDVRGEIYTLTVEIVENQIGSFFKNLICEDRLILIEHFVHVHHITDRQCKISISILKNVLIVGWKDRVYFQRMHIYNVMNNF